MKIAIYGNWEECPRLGIVKGTLLIGYPDADIILHQESRVYESKQAFFDHIKKRYFVDRFKWQKPEISEKLKFIAVVGEDTQPKVRRYI